MDEVSATIDKLAFGGNGVCRINGKVCFVPLSCPGDEVRLAITSEKRSYSLARITDIVVPSPHRVSPPCPVFGTCGGCSWQHIDYVQQILTKQQILAESLWRGARVPPECVRTTLSSPEQYGYRSRVQFKLHVTGGRLQIGFFRSNSHVVEDIGPGCAIAMPVINRVLSVLRSVLPSCPELSSIPRISVDCAGQSVIAVVSWTGRDTGSVASFFQDRQAELAPLTGVYLNAGGNSLQKLFGDDQLSYDLPVSSNETEPCHLSYQPGGFSQVNRAQNRAMLKVIRQMAAFKGFEQVLDLYCGNGNFSLPLAAEVAAVTGIEEYPASIVSAQENQLLNGITNAEFICADAAAGLKQLASQGRRFDTVILDPPRAGAADVVTDLCRMHPEKIIYVSCDPSTLSRDCGILAGTGYSVRESVPIDMFPQTYHLESVTLLQKQ